MLLTWFAPILITFCFFKPYEAWWYLRYLLPAIPALIISALLTMKNILHYFSRSSKFITAKAKVVPAFLLAIILATELYQTKKLNVLEIDENERIYKKSCFLAAGKFPEHSLVLAMQLSGALIYYTKFIPCRWERLSPETFEFLKIKAEAQGYQWYALLFPFEEEEFQKKAPGRWKNIGRLKHVSLWRLIPTPLE